MILILILWLLYANHLRRCLERLLLHHNYEVPRPQNWERVWERTCTSQSFPYRRPQLASSFWHWSWHSCPYCTSAYMYNTQYNGHLQITSTEATFPWTKSSVQAIIIFSSKIYRHQINQFYCRVPTFTYVHTHTQTRRRKVPKNKLDQPTHLMFHPMRLLFLTCLKREAVSGDGVHSHYTTLHYSTPHHDRTDNQSSVVPSCGETVCGFIQCLDTYLHRWTFRL